MNLESGVLQVHIEDIIPNRFQPRLTFDEQGLKELSDSIREHGIIQPLVLRKLGDKFEIIAGERRYKAAQIAGLTTVPAVIANIDDNKSAEVALVENVQRRDLTAIEEARSYKSLLDKGYLTQEQLAKRMGLSQPAIANKLRLLNLDEEVQQALLEEKISERHARTLLTLQDKEAQKEWLHRVINERLTVRQLDLELKKLKSSDGDSEEIPLVSMTPSIEDIRANAMDINLANKLENKQNTPETLETLDVATQPETLTLEENPSPFATFNPNQTNEINNSFTTATTIPEFNIATPNSASAFISKETLTTPENNTNKFFDLNASPTNFNNNQEMDSLFTPASEIKPPENNFEIFNPSPIENPFLKNENNLPSNNITNNNLNSSFEMNPNNKFFTAPPTPTPEVNIIQNNQPEINPMDAVKNLTSINNTNSNVNGKLELKDAITTVRNCIETLGDKGFFIDVEEIDFDTNYQITMRIHKDN